MDGVYLDAAVDGASGRGGSGTASAVEGEWRGGSGEDWAAGIGIL